MFQCILVLIAFYIAASLRQISLSVVFARLSHVHVDDADDLFGFLKANETENEWISVGKKIEK